MLKFLDDLGYRFLAGVGARLCGHTVLPLGLAAFIYAVGGLVLPLALGWSTYALVVTNVLATLVAACILLAWLAAEVDARFGRHLVEWTTDIRRLDASEFEWLVAELFTREGWNVRRTGQQGRPDGNIDVDMSKEGRRAVVQCKCWGRWQVGVDMVRAFAGTLKREGLLREGDGFLVSLSIAITTVGAWTSYSNIGPLIRRPRTKHHSAATY